MTPVAQWRCYHYNV